MSLARPFAIFRYDPHSPDESEWRVRAEIQKLATRLENETGGQVGVVSLATLFWQSIRDSESIDALVDLERQHGFEAAGRQVNSYLSDEYFRPLQNLLQKPPSHGLQIQECCSSYTPRCLRRLPIEFPLSWNR